MLLIFRAKLKEISAMEHLYLMKDILSIKDKAVSRILYNFLASGRR